jgi:hypothetical protein
MRILQFRPTVGSALDDPSHYTKRGFDLTARGHHFNDLHGVEYRELRQSLPNATGVICHFFYATIGIYGAYNTGEGKKGNTSPNY